LITGAGKVCRLPEFRHKFHLTIQREAASVVAADQLAPGTRLTQQQIAAVGAYGGQAANHILLIATEQQGLVQKFFEQHEWINIAAAARQAEVAGRLPGSGKDLFA
jgi:hypothetical protein